MGPHGGTLHPTPCTLHPAPCTLHPAPCTLHPAPCTLHPAPYTLHPAPCTLHPAPYTLHPAPCALTILQGAGCRTRGLITRAESMRSQWVAFRVYLIWFVLHVIVKALCRQQVNGNKAIFQGQWVATRDGRGERRLKLRP